VSAPDLHIEDSGDGHPVVLLHGLTATHRYVVHGSRALERSGHRVIAYDARGHGASAPAEVYDYPSLTDDLVAVLDGLGVERAVLAGASMGAHTLLRLALEQPERVAGAVVITPAWTEDRDPGLDGWDRLARGLREAGVDGFVAAYDFGRMPRAWQATVEKVLRQRLAAHEHPLAVADALEQVPRSAPYASVDALAGLDTAIPVAVVADRDDADPGHPLAIGERYAATIPGARLVVEPEGESPIAWRGGQLSQVIAGVAEQARW
jgi:pimeloyl-ACP methyl ester carboxylesterase